MSSTQLTDVELAQMRSDLETLLPDTCVLQTLTSTSDGQGGFTDSWAAAGTVVCRLDNEGGRRSVSSAAIQPFSGWRLTVPVDTDLSTANRVVHGGETYAVIAVSDTGSWLACRRADLERIS